MSHVPAYTRKQWIRAVNVSALLGWIIVAVPFAAETSGSSVTNFLGIMVWTAAIGLPIALLICWTIVAPILKFVLNRPMSWLRASWWGVVTSSTIALASIVLGRLWGWLQSLNPNTGSQSGSGHKITQIDGILTSYGWLLLGQSTAMFVIAGVVISLLIRAFIGPGLTTAVQGKE